MGLIHSKLISPYEFSASLRIHWQANNSLITNFCIAHSFIQYNYLIINI
jgi:hypothetical protein